MEDGMEIPLKTRDKTTILPSNPTPRHMTWGNQNGKRHMYPTVHCSTITIARTWKQPRCASTDEWRKKLWYIYTMKYYSAIKRNAVRSNELDEPRAYYTPVN